MKMDFHRNNRMRAIAPVAAAFVLSLLAGGAVVAQNAATVPSTFTTLSSADAEDRPVPPGKSGIESLPIGKGGHGQNAWDLAQTLGALAIVVGLIFVASWLLRRAGGRQTRGGQDAMEILVRKSISARQQLLLVRLGQRLVLVGSSAGALSTLCEITDQGEVASMLESVQAGQGGFAGLLKGKIAKRGTGGGTGVPPVSSPAFCASKQGEETHGPDAHATGGAKP
jgi:flagellar protein FliO/FliZ